MGIGSYVNSSESEIAELCTLANEGGRRKVYLSLSCYLNLNHLVTSLYYLSSGFEAFQMNMSSVRRRTQKMRQYLHLSSSHAS